MSLKPAIGLDSDAMPPPLVKDVGNSALLLLRFVAGASDAFPPLKSASSGALQIVDLIKA